jgi:hypothetical protein
MRSARSKHHHVVAGAGELLCRGQPAGPEPMTATACRSSLGTASGTTQPSAHARSMIETSTCLMATGSALMPTTHATRTAPGTAGR